MGYQERTVQAESGVSYCPWKQESVQKPMGTYQVNTGARLKKFPLANLGKHWVSHERW